MAWRTFCLALCSVASFAFSPAAAAAEKPHLLVLRSDIASSDLNTALDRELMRELGARDEFADTTLSPTPYSDIELAVGCQGATDACVQRVAQIMGSDWLLVRELRQTGEGKLLLTLTAQDGARMETKRAEATLSPTLLDEPARVVPQLIESLYGSGLGTRSSADAGDDSKASGARPLRIVGFSALGASSALLASGVAMAIVAHGDHQNYAHTDVQDAASAQHANDLLNDARRRTAVARTLIISGAVVGVSGAAFLLWDSLRERSHPSRLALSVQAGPAGGFLALSGPIGRTSP